MKPEKVTLTDTSNRTLAAGSDSEGFSAASAQDAQETTESRLQARIMDIVEGVVGVGGARVQVTADIDHSRSTTQEQRYDPDGQVVRSTATNGSESFKQKHVIPDSIDLDAMSSSFSSDGVLVIKAPKK